MSSIRWIEAATFGSNNDIPPRAHHTSSIVGSFMYIIGGTSGSTFFNDVRVIDLKGADHDWSIPRLIRTMGTSEVNDVQMHGDSRQPFEGRSRHTASTVKNSKGETSIYIYGGVHGKDKMYSLSLGSVLQWHRITAATGEAPTDLFSHCATSIKNKIYLFGGLDQSSTCTSSLYVFDTLLLHWEKFKFSSSLMTKHPVRVKGAFISSNILLIHTFNECFFCFFFFSSSSQLSFTIGVYLY
jgi:N-acetylneuraminic acid mutarotase